MKANFKEIVQDELNGSNMKPGALIKGKIMDIQKNWVVVDTRLKTESILPLEEFEGNSEDTIRVGDEIELMLESVENGLGRTEVSYGKARFWRKWLELEQANKEDILVGGLIKNRVRGGFSVFVGGIKCFLPGSLIEIGEGVNPAAFENTEGKFKVIKISRSRFNVVLSHKSSGDEKSENEKRDFFESLMKAGVARGKVKKILDFGAFIDLGKGEGLVYIADIMWKRIQHPSDVLKVGEEYEFKVIGYNKEKNRLSLSLREMHDNPWNELAGKITEGQEVSGAVTKIDKYGFFVELSPGIVGLVYLSEIDWLNKSPSPSKYVDVGDKVNVKILTIDISARRISLSYKQCFNNPWHEYAEIHSIGDIVEGPVTGSNKSGIFIGLTGRLDGFIHSSNIDWDLPQDEALKLHRKGDPIKAQITLLDANKEKVALSIKKITPNPFMDFFKRKKVKKSILNCTIKSVANNKVIVTIDENLDGVILASELGGDRMKDPADLYQVGEELTVMLWRIDIKKKMIFLSVRAISEKEDKEVLEEQKKKKGGFLSTLGDILNIKDKEVEPTEEQETEEESEEEEDKS